MNKRYIKNQDLVYWPEYDRDNTDGRFRYIVECGYYLATYECNNTDIHIVSYGSITSCVVRHLHDEMIFPTNEEALAKANELNSIEL